MAVMRQHFWRLFDTGFYIKFCTVRCSKYSERERANKRTKGRRKNVAQKIARWFFEFSAIVAKSWTHQTTAEEKGLRALKQLGWICINKRFYSFQQIYLLYVRNLYQTHFHEIFSCPSFAKSFPSRFSFEFWTYLAFKMFACFLHMQRKHLLMKVYANTGVAVVKGQVNGGQ